MRIAFWVKESKNLVSHKDGLSAEDITELQKLKVGDRLILWCNSDKKHDGSPDFNLKPFITKDKPVVSTEVKSTGFKPVK